MLDALKSNTLRTGAIVAAVVAVVAVAAVVAWVLLAPANDTGADDARGVVTLDDGTKVATYADEDGLDDEAATWIDEDFDAFEDVYSEHDAAGTYEDGLGRSYYNAHRAATGEEVAQLVQRLEGWWRPFTASSEGTSVRIHDGVCEEYSGSGELVAAICSIDDGSVLRFDDGLRAGITTFDDGPGYFIEGLFTTDGKSSLRQGASDFLMQGSYILDEQPEGATERLEELQLHEVAMDQSGYLYRIDAPDWAREAGLADSAGASSASSETSSADEAAARKAIDEGKQVFTGKVVVTTKGHRRSELGLRSRSDDSATIAYLEFDEPREYLDATGGTVFSHPDCTTLGFSNPGAWKRYEGKRVIVSAKASDFSITDETVERLYDFTGHFELVKVCTDGNGSTGYRAIGAIGL